MATPVTLSDSISSVSSQAVTAKDQAYEAFNLDPSDKEGINKLGQEIGAKADRNGNYSLEALQLEAKNNFEQKSQNISLLSSLMDSINQVRQRIIDALGR